jgi:Cupredoxin-like domain
VKDTRQLKTGEVATMFRDTKGARIAAFSSNGKALDALVVRGHCGQNHTIRKEQTNEKRRINYINHDINSHLKTPIHMTRKRRRQNGHSVSSKRMTRKRLISYGIIAVIISGISITGYKSLIPTNGNTPVLGVPNNHFIKAIYSRSSGYAWVSLSSGSVKGSRGSSGAGITDPTYVFNRGGLQSMHLINEDYETHSKHNFNIDELNVHSKDLGYYESQIITFVADKPGTFQYYCTIHPEMKGNITIE